VRDDPSSSPSSAEHHMTEENPGMSNRESAGQERAERAAHPPADTNPPSPEDRR
jgi:hypothetical protein